MKDTESLFSFRYRKGRWVVQTRRIRGWNVGVFRNPPFVIFDFGVLRVEVARR